MKPAPLLILGLLLLSTPACAGPMEDGKAAYDRHDYMAAMDFWKPLAEQGNAEAAYLVAGLYQNGQGMPPDPAEAHKWFRKAAETTEAKNEAKALAPVDDTRMINGLKFKAGQGDLAATLRLGDIYTTQKHDPVEALKWYNKAVGAGNAEAVYDIGTFYDAGLGVKQDPAEAMRWYLKAANMGFGKAQAHLGWIYANGASKDYVEAMRWLRKAIDQGHAHYTVGVMQIDAQNEVGALFEHGYGVPQDYTEAAKWYRLAADRGTPEAQLTMSRLYAAGKGVPQDDQEAYFWLSLAAKDVTSGLSLPPDALDTAAKKLEPDQIQAVKLRVVSWKPSNP